MPKKVTHSEEWWQSAPHHVIRCTAHYKTTGELCRSEAHTGTNVCLKHGALAPHVQAAAATRIAMSAEAILSRLSVMLDDPAVDAREKVKICLDWLDRAGLGATSKHLVGVVSDDPVEILFRAIAADPHGTFDPETVEVQAVPAHVAELNARADDDASFAEWEADADVVDAELVDEPAAVSNGRSPTIPPKHIREALERLL